MNAILNDVVSSLQNTHKLNFKISLTLLIFLFLVKNTSLFGQDAKNDSTSVVVDVSKQVDIKDFLRTIFTKKEIAESDSTKKSIAKEDPTKKNHLDHFILLWLTLAIH